MIDKVWYDWQNRDTSNKNAFAGGTVSWQAGASYSEYPTGGPPFLNVRGNFQLMPGCNEGANFNYRRVPRSLAMACGRRLQLAMFWTRLVEGSVTFMNDDLYGLPFCFR